MSILIFLLIKALCGSTGMTLLHGQFEEINERRAQPTSRQRS